MAFIAMSTANPLGKRPFGTMLAGLSPSHLAGDFDFPGAPIPMRDPLLAGEARGELLRPPPPVSVLPVASPWTDAEGPVMTLGDATTSTQTVVPTTNTTPQVSAAVPGGTTVATSWFSQQNLIPGLDNWAVLLGFLAIVGVGAAMAKGGN